MAGALGRVLAASFKRLIHIAFVVWLLISALFAAMAIMKSNPVSLFLDTRLTPQRQIELKRIYGYDLPVWQQYGRYLGNCLRGELGVSFTHKQSVAAVILPRAAKTLWLGGLAYLIGIGLSLTLLAASHRARARSVRRGAANLAMALFAVPSFITATLLLAVFGTGLGWFPMYGSHALFRGEPAFWPSFFDLLRHSFLPAMSLALPIAGLFATYMHEQLRTLEDASLVVSARGRGISEARIFWNHKMRVLLPGLVQLAGLYLPMLAAGAMVIEAIFGWSGMGLLLFDAVSARDYPLLLGGSIWTACFVVAGYELADAMRARLKRKAVEP